MQVKVDRLENSRVKLSVEVEPERMDKAMEQAYIKIRGQVRIPGFRKGKAPRQILETYLGKGALMEEAADILLPEAYEEAVATAEVEPVDQPSVSIEQFEEEKPFIFTAEVTVKPEVSISGYKGIEISKKKVAVTDEDVDREAEALRERLAKYEAVEDAVAASGDMVVVDFQGTIDGEPFDGGSAENVNIEIGAGRFMQEFEDALIGAAMDEERQAEVNFPEDYHGAEVAGKTAVFIIKVKEIKKKVLPELNDELVKKVSAKETMAEFREEIRARLTVSADREVEQQMRSEAVEKAAEKAIVEIPEVMVEHEIDHMARDLESRLQYQGLNLQAYLQATEKDEAAFREELKPQAEKRVRAELALETIARLEELEVSREEIDEAIDNMARSYGQTPEKFRKKGVDKYSSAVKEGLLRDKSVEFILTNAKIVEVE